MDTPPERGMVHVVVVVGDRLRDVAGVVIGTSGFYVDVTESYERDIRGVSEDAVGEITAHRAEIEQARGMLMLVYGISAQRAFEILVWRSQQTNTKLRELAARAGARWRRPATPAGSSRSSTHLLLLAHPRVHACSTRPRVSGWGMWRSGWRCCGVVVVHRDRDPGVVHDPGGQRDLRGGRQSGSSRASGVPVTTVDSARGWAWSSSTSPR